MGRLCYFSAMQILSLNTWGGRLHAPLFDFLTAHADADVLCLQEIYRDAAGKENRPESNGQVLNLFDDICARLPAHRGYFRPSVGDFYGVAAFVKKPVIAEGGFPIYDNPGWQGGSNHPRTAQYVVIEHSGQPLVIGNVHGLWHPSGKGDLPERLEQSQRLMEFVAARRQPTVLIGDFNLRPDTESVALLEARLRNLISEFGVTSTRTSIYTKAERHADYAFVSPDIDVVDFAVLPDEVSDHSPLLLTIR